MLQAFAGRNARRCFGRTPGMLSGELGGAESGQELPCIVRIMGGGQPPIKQFGAAALG
jgi:hypothetical protein